MIEYKLIPGCKAYWAGSDGTIKSKFRILKPRLNKGYPEAVVKMMGRWRKISIGRLVCLAFYGMPPEGKPQAAHRNDVKTDNRPENLYWASQMQNYLDSIRNKRQAPPKLKTKKQKERTKLQNKILKTYRFGVCGFIKTAKICGTNERYVMRVIHKYASRQLCLKF